MVGFAAFQAQTRMSTIPLLPPERSHICIAFASVLWAQASAGSGVGTAAAADSEGAALGASALAAGAADDGAAPLGAGVADPEPHAPTTRIAAIARVGNLSRFLIPFSSISSGPGVSDERDAAGSQPRAWHTVPRTQTSAYIRLHYYSGLQNTPSTVRTKEVIDGRRPARHQPLEPGERLAGLPRGGRAGRPARLRPRLDVGPHLRDLRRSRTSRSSRATRPSRHSPRPPNASAWACSSARTPSGIPGWR